MQQRGVFEVSASHEEAVFYLKYQSWLRGKENEGRHLAPAVMFVRSI